MVFRVLNHTRWKCSNGNPLSHNATKHQAFQERIAGQSIFAMHAARHLPNGVQAGNNLIVVAVIIVTTFQHLSLGIHGQAAHAIVKDRSDLANIKGLRVQILGKGMRKDRLAKVILTPPCGFLVAGQGSLERVLVNGRNAFFLLLAIEILGELVQAVTLVKQLFPSVESHVLSGLGGPCLGEDQVKGWRYNVTVAVTSTILPLFEHTLSDLTARSQFVNKALTGRIKENAAHAS
mmetsp:Transcript_6023/g.16930  ORF Transcript_6023/g.16930 Transcript_6023/m.16930 type:complete len:234 (+) Transcript_6023:358-1059(+)